MFLLLDELKKIVHISKMAEKVTINNVDYIKVSNNNMIVDNNYDIVEVENIPVNITTEKYMYVDGEFVVNENYIDDSLVAEYETRLATLQETNATQEEVIDKLEDDITALEEMMLDVTASLLE